jgi:hypothetical protein
MAASVSKRKSISYQVWFAGGTGELLVHGTI